MIIVSQDRKSIYNFDNVKSIDILGNEIYIADDILADEGACIAKYATEERVKEVLQEIIEEYKNGNAVSSYEGYGYVMNRVYEMPEE